jgi:hypothetical protein
MSDNYFGLTGMTDNNVAPHPNPYYEYTQVFTPRRLKELFKWCEFLFYNSPHIYSALRKFGEYPITDITYDTINDALRHKHKYLLERVIRARELLIKATLDKYVYGNAFISMYQPFIRYLKCPKCGVQTNIEYLDYQYSVRNIQFTFTCDHCKQMVIAKKEHVIDKKLTQSRKVNFIRWDPKLMDIDYNDITGVSIYYYTIPQTIIQRVNAGHKHLIDSLPLGFLEAIKSNKRFKFAPKAIFHMKIGGPAGINPQWGLPPLLSVLQLFHYTAILRKANEAIALDHLVPFRILHPAPASGNSDPVIQMSLSRWQDSFKQNLRQWRKDPLHMMFAPVPVGLTQIGGQGRALLTLGEVQEAEKNIVAALGIPIEFIYGGLTGSGMEATLRLIENQLETHINDLLDLLQWVDDKCAQFLGWERVSVSMTKFRMVDDNTNKGVVLQMWLQGQQGGAQIVSNETLAKMYDIDLENENRLIKQETLDNVRKQQTIQREIMNLQNAMAEQVKMEAQQNGPMNYNQQEIISRADQTVQQLMQVDDGTRKSMLHQLQVEDFVLYSVVIQRLEQQQTSTKQQAVSQMGGGY